MYNSQDCGSVPENTAAMPPADGVFKEQCASGNDSMLLPVSRLKLHFTAQSNEGWFVITRA